MTLKNITTLKAIVNNGHHGAHRGAADEGVCGKSRINQPLASRQTVYGLFVAVNAQVAPQRVLELPRVLKWNKKKWQGGRK